MIGVTTINDILHRPQRIGDNLSSSQMYKIFDTFIERSLLPLADTSPTFLEFVAELISLATIFRKRIDDDALSICFRSMLEPTKHLNDLVSSGIDRGLMFNYLVLVNEFGEQLIEAHVNASRSKPNPHTSQTLASTSKLLGNHQYLIAALHESTYWTSKAIDFRDQIIEKYIRLIYKESIRDSKRSAGKVDKDDLFSQGYLIVMHAVERFNGKKGVLTSYINLWLRSLFKEQAVQSIGLAYIPKTPSNDAYSAELDLALDVIDESLSHQDYDDNLLRQISLLEHDPDVRNALIVSNIRPPLVTRLANSNPA